MVNKAISTLTDNVDLVVTHQDLTARAQQRTPSAAHVSVENFMDSPRYDEIVELLQSTNRAPAAAPVTAPVPAASAATAAAADSRDDFAAAGGAAAADEPPRIHVPMSMTVWIMPVTRSIAPMTRVAEMFQIGTTALITVRSSTDSGLLSASTDSSSPSTIAL